MHVNPSPKELGTNKNGPEKMCMGVEKGRQLKLGNNKRLEEQLEKPQVKKPKWVKQGEATPSQENLESNKVEETSNIEVLRLFL